MTISGLIEPVRGDSPILYHDIGPRERIPQLALVANPHQELNGMFVLSRLAAFLRDIAAGERQDLRLRERVLIIPTVAEVPQGQESSARKTARQRWAMTETVATITQGAYYRIALHPRLETEEMPQVWLYGPNDDERASACLFGLPAVIERPLEPGDAPDLVRAWRRQGGENFVIHAGQAGSLQTRHCESLFRALVAFLDRTGIVSGLRLADEDEDLGYFGLRQVFVVLAEQSGLFSSRQEVGRWVRAGEELGRVYDSFTGSEQGRILAPVAGLLASLRRQPLLREGDLAARILMPERAFRREQSHGR